jgi:hypothetical protein
MRYFIVCILILFISIPAALMAESGDIQIFLNGGLQLPLSPNAFKDNWNLGFGGGVGVVYSLTPIIRITGEFDFHYFGLDQSGLNIPAGERAEGGEAMIMYASGGVRILPMANSGNSMQLILLAGGGFYRVQTTDLKSSTYTFAEGDEENTFGVHAGCGVEFKGFFAEALFILGFTEGDPTGHLPIRVGYILKI